MPLHTFAWVGDQYEVGQRIVGVFTELGQAEGEWGVAVSQKNVPPSTHKLKIRLRSEDEAQQALQLVAAWWAGHQGEGQLADQLVASAAGEEQEPGFGAELVRRVVAQPSWAAAKALVSKHFKAAHVAHVVRESVRESEERWKAELEARRAAGLARIEQLYPRTPGKQRGQQQTPVLRQGQKRARQEGGGEPSVPETRATARRRLDLEERAQQCEGGAAEAEMEAARPCSPTIDQHTAAGRESVLQAKKVTAAAASKEG